MNSSIGWTVRAVAVVVIAWALMAPIGHQTSVAEADHLSSTPTAMPSSANSAGRGRTGLASEVYAMASQAYSTGSATTAGARPGGATTAGSSTTQQAQYSVAPGAIANYYRARGGARTFGEAISNRFTLLGF